MNKRQTKDLSDLIDFMKKLTKICSQVLFIVIVIFFFLVIMIEILSLIPWFDDFFSKLIFS